MSMHKVEQSHWEVDMRNWMCPYPKLLCERIFAQIVPASRIDVLVDCPSAVEEIPALGQRMGFEVLDVSLTAEGEWKLVLRKR